MDKVPSTVDEVPGRNRCVLPVEAIDADGRRYPRSWTSSRIPGRLPQRAAVIRSRYRGMNPSSVEPLIR